MKVLKGFFLVIIIFLILIFLMSAQLLFAVNKTILEPGYFDRMYRENDMDEALKEVMEKQFENITTGAAENGDGSIDIKLDPMEYIDADWLIEEMADAVKHTYEYFTGGENDLPEIDIEPLKDMMMDAAVDQLMEYGSFTDNLGNLDAIIASYDSMAGEVGAGEVDEAAIESIVQANAEIGLTSDILETIIVTYKSLDEGLSEDDKIRAITERIINDQMGLDEMDDELDINDIVDEMYPRGENPLEAVRTIILAVKNTLFYALLTILLLLVLIVVFTAFRPASIFGWLSAPLIMAGLSGVGFWVLGWILSTMGGLTEAFGAEAFEGAESFARFVEGYLKGIFSFALVQGLIVLGAGVVFAILAGVLAGNSNRKTREQDEQNKNAALIVVRVLVVIVLLIAIVVATSTYYVKMYDDISEAVDVLEKTEPVTGFMEAASEIAGLPFLGGIGEK